MNTYTLDDLMGSVQVGEAMDTLANIAVRLTARGVRVQLLGDAEVFRVVTDTRQLTVGDLFVALRGERFDGNEFALRAVSLGATACIVDREIPGLPAQLVVDDTLHALQQYAASWRADFAYPVIGVTGSNGKTTTKQLLAAVCGQRGEVLATEGNLNNHIGVPLTLLRLSAHQQTAVIEMGANHRGEIAQLAALARPDIAVVTMAGDAHLEGFGSREGVAQGKGELFQALQGQGVAIINADDAYAPLWRQLAGASRMLGFGLGPGADIGAENLHLEAESSRFRLLTPIGSAEVRLPLTGRHNVTNALAAAAAGIALGLMPEQVAQGLMQVQGAAGRLNWRRTREGARLIDDSYNANPSSLRAAQEVLAVQPGQRWLVLGDMKELGEHAAELHEQAGRSARALGIDRLYALGPLAAHAVTGFGPHGQAFEDFDALRDALQDDLQRAAIDKGLTVLVKGSRSSRMERVVHALCGSEGANMKEMH